MIPVICINDKNRPAEIRPEKWVKKDREYHIIYTTLVLPQRKVACTLAEIEFTDAELPYEYFLLERFAIKPEDMEALLQLIQDCGDTAFSMDELMKQTELEEA